MNAQDNHGYGGDDGHFKSLAEEVTKLKRVMICSMSISILPPSAQVETDNEHEWSTGFKNKHLRLEIKGNLTDKLYYRFCYRMTNSNVARSEDNFARSTDVVMIGYRFLISFRLRLVRYFSPLVAMKWMRTLSISMSIRT